MKILMHSPLFYPSIGGTETIASILAHEFVKQGHEVKLITHTPSSEENNFPFEIIRKPSFTKYLKLTFWSNLYFHIQISLKGYYPLLLIPRPLAISHQTWTLDQSWKGKIKRKIFNKSINICNSNAVANHLDTKTHVVFNTYQSEIFKNTNKEDRTKELVFLGRLVSDKGADLLIEALSILKKDGLTPKLTIVGLGEDEEKLKKQVDDLNLKESIIFVGTKTGHELAEILNQHQIMVVPSRWAEPFGIVALEGMACGCLPIVSEQGGLPDAIGNCGITFPNGNAEKLAEAIKKLVLDENLQKSFHEKMIKHLENYSPENIAKSYLDIFKKQIKNK